MSPLKNPEAEACAQAIAEVIKDKVERQKRFESFLATHPGLKNWEGQAIGQRAVWLAKEKTLAEVRT